MFQSQTQKKQLAWPSLIGRWAVSASMVSITQFALSLVPRFLSASSLLAQLSLSVVVLVAVLGLGGWFRRILGIHSSASAFVFFTIIFIWCFYVLVIRQAVSLVMDFVFNGQVVMLVTGLCRILKSDPGIVLCENYSGVKLVESSVSEVRAHGDEELELSTTALCCEPTEASVLGRRVRYCRSCKANIKGFDHHCPAFGNCIGNQSCRFFLGCHLNIKSANICKVKRIILALLVGFLVIEASYLACSFEYIAKFGISSRMNSEMSLFESLAFSTRMFSILQLVWQVPFFAWHIYCICFNIRTDEWINWLKYPEFQSIVQSQLGQSSTEKRFTNPYDKGILHNVKDFLSSSQW